MCMMSSFFNYLSNSCKMLHRWGLLFTITIIILGVCECKQEQDTIEKALQTSYDSINATSLAFDKALDATLALIFKPFEMLGIFLENSFVSGSGKTGEFVMALGSEVKKLATKFQEEEEKLVGCIQTEQFDPAKAIVKDILSCVTSKVDVVTGILMKSVTSINGTYEIGKSLLLLPKCEGAKCYADFTSGIMSKLGQIAAGLTSIGKDVGVGLAGIPATLPICFATKPETSPAKIFGLLGANIMKCFTA